MDILRVYVLRCGSSGHTCPHRFYIEKDAENKSINSVLVVMSKYTSFDWSTQYETALSFVVTCLNILLSPLVTMICVAVFWKGTRAGTTVKAATLLWDAGK